MKRKVGVIVFFVVVFGLPVSWYLILQIFGENKFDLPKLGAVSTDCPNNADQAVLLLDSAHFSASPNQYKRLKSHMAGVQQNELILVYSQADCLGEFDALLVDEQAEIRGEYQVSREEMDRLLTEVDIYLLNLRERKGEVK